MQHLRVADIQADGLQVRPARKRRIPAQFIPFGSEWESLPKAAVGVYVTAARPTEFLFFRRSPRDKAEPISRQTLNAAIAKLHPESTIGSLREQHFRMDFARMRSPQEARFHLRNVHGISNSFAHTLIAGGSGNHHPKVKGFVNEANTIPVPAPYFLVALCASRVLPEEHAKAAIPESGGGKRFVMTWYDVCGYKITVDWPRSFAVELAGPGKKRARVLRLLYQIAFEFWFEGRRSKLPDVKKTAIRERERPLLDRFVQTSIKLQRLPNCAESWSADLFEYGSRRRSFRVPLIEDMNRRGWHNQCSVCWHPKRNEIEREMPELATSAVRVNGFAELGRKYGVSSISLRRHCGRVGYPKGRGDLQRSHFSVGNMAPVLFVSRSFFQQLATLSETELIIYSLVLFEQASGSVQGVELSSTILQQKLGLQLNESRLSVALNHLGPTACRLVEFHRVPSGFRVKLTDR